MRVYPMARRCRSGNATCPKIPASSNWTASHMSGCCVQYLINSMYSWAAFMFVTSDLFDLERIGRFRGFEWRENLVGGVVVHGTNWLGYEAAATYLLEAAKRCGVL